MDRHVLIELKSAITIPGVSPTDEPAQVEEMDSREGIDMSRRILVFALDDVIQEVKDGIPESLRIKTLYVHPAEGYVMEEGEVRIPRENIASIVQFYQDDH